MGRGLCDHCPGRRTNADVALGQQRVERRAQPQPRERQQPAQRGDGTGGE